MSYIDTFDSEFVGYFGALPVYHPLETVPFLPDDDPRDFACSPEHLVIGGGAGEHPGVILKDPAEAVRCFVRAWLRWQEEFEPDEFDQLQPVIAAWSGRRNCVPSCGRRNILEFAGWQVADYQSFAQHCESKAFRRPFDPGEDSTIELWLAESLGEFVLFALPELAPAAVQEMGDLRGKVRPLYQNLQLVPPGYPVWGRREIDGRVNWGLSAWQIQRAQNSHTIR